MIYYNSPLFSILQDPRNLCSSAEMLELDCQEISEIRFHEFSKLHYFQKFSEGRFQEFSELHFQAYGLIEL